MKTVTKGSGITEYVVHQTETDDELKLAVREMAKRKAADGFEFALGEDVEAWVRRTLHDATREAIAVEHSREWYAARVLRTLRYVRAEITSGDAAQAAAQALRLGDLIAEAHIKFRWEKTALIGKKFVAGRKSGTGGPIRKALVLLLEKKPSLKNAELWKAIAASPPRGWEARENQLGKYFDGPEGVTVSYARICNVAAEERRKQKAR